MKNSMIGIPRRKKENRQAGFTLMELLVAISVFSMVVVMVAGLITRLIFIERRDIGEQALEEDIRFFLEVFSREARLSYASDFALADTTGRSILMRNQNGNCVSYRLSDETGVIERAETTHIGSSCTEASFSGRFSTLTSARVHFDTLRFDIPDDVYNVGDNRLDRQGFITIIIKAHATNRVTPPLELQTTVASRQVRAYQLP